MTRRHWKCSITSDQLLALAIRGTYARDIWLEAVGPSDPILARRTDPNSLCALYGGESRDECLLFCPRNPDRIHSELCRWFGGRVPPSGVINVGPTSNEFIVSGKWASKKDSTAQTEKDIASKQPVATLTATVRSDIIVVVSPLVPTKCLGLILATCQRRISGLSASVFTNQPVINRNNKPNDKAILSHGPSTFLLLHKENAFHAAASLMEAFMVQMSLQGVLAELAASLMANGSDIEICSSIVFHVTPYSDSIPHSDLSTTPGYITPRLHTNAELEQIVVLTLTGHQMLKTFGLFLGQILGVVPYCKSQPPAFKHGLELLGIKWLPSLSLQHAKELTPYEVGEPAWKPSLQKLTSGISPNPGVEFYDEPVFETMLSGPRPITTLLLCKPNVVQHHLAKLIKRLTQEGFTIVCCPCQDPIANLSAYRQRDAITHLHKPTELGQQPATKCSGNTSKVYQLPVTPLTQTNCVILMPALFEHQTRNKNLAFVDVLEHLLNKGDIYRKKHSMKYVFMRNEKIRIIILIIKVDRFYFRFHIVGVRMLWLTEEQAQHMLHINDAGSFTLVPELISGPSVVVAVQRDNAVMAFDSLLGSVYEKDSVFVKYGKHILQPKDCSHANRLLCYFFNDLIPAAHVEIVTKSPNDE
ncbi:hypothetical protein LSH36_485g02057 [Paralvinella palmiformis]|uniref:Nucleoside diphosphate kinase-like domain-containing protein n=1 Tax=Paralvinella palmiformis TaxID=53620 RepID=A0AAD9JA34_9ANNE|nr:hypothetical protein LSH36_485g02057 [Paralvinella palmiformis]